MYLYVSDTQRAEILLATTNFARKLWLPISTYFDHYGSVMTKAINFQGIAPISLYILHSMLIKGTSLKA